MWLVLPNNLEAHKKIWFTLYVMAFTLIKPQIKEIGDYILFDKPQGLNTHAPDYGNWGLVEIFEATFKQKFYVVHRLDKSTSGTIIFAKTADAARSIGEQFETKQVQKEYLFLTDKKSSQNEFHVKSWIGKDRGLFISKDKGAENNSETFLSYVKEIGPYFLWKATPVTGKPHQIRLHAESSGIPILGDEKHGGTSFYRVCLHSRSIHLKINGVDQNFSTPLPIWATQHLPADEWAVHEALELRKNLFGFNEDNKNCMRMIHRELNSFRMDQFGDVFWVYWYLDRDLNEADMNKFRSLSLNYNRKVYIRKMLNRGEDSNSEHLWRINANEDRWSASENGVNYEFRANSGMSPGLFLDQRDNRIWVRENSKDKMVLNLFSYTGGFSVNAALGEAKEVVSVDVSENYNNWAKKNFELNGLDPEKFEFWSADSLVFLKGCYARKRKFDLIVCDPPSFGRSRNGVFSVSKNLEELLIQCLFSLHSGGILLFSTNYEKWSIFELKKQIEKLRRSFRFNVQDTPPTGLDFEMPGNPSLLKSVLIYKK